MATKTSAKSSSINKNKKRKLDQDELELNSITKKVNKVDNEVEVEYKTLIEEKFGISLPPDFFTFYQFLEIEKDGLNLLNLELCGPYDLMTGRINKTTTLTPVELQMHGRHYFDLPEMTTVLLSKKDGYHISYFRDDPKEIPSMLVCNKSKVSGEITVCGDNLFAAAMSRCKDFLKSSKRNKPLKNLMASLENHAKESGYELGTNTKKIKLRNKGVVTKAINNLGIVPPMNNDIGYRELPCTNGELRKLLKNISTAQSEEEKDGALDELQDMITLVQFANDECDYGMGYELGVDLFAYGDPSLHGALSHLLPLAYQLMKREQFSHILEKHLQDRSRDKPL